MGSSSSSSSSWTQAEAANGIKGDETRADKTQAAKHANFVFAK
jgi:hypothetical protein